MKQKYVVTDEHTNLVTTKLMSWQQFKGKRQASIKVYILELLQTCSDTGMTCREISNYSGIWVQSLTYPLKSLVESNQIQIIGIKTSSVSNRKVMVYGISNQLKLEV